MYTVHVNIHVCIYNVRRCSPVMSDKLHLMVFVTALNTVDTDGIRLCTLTCQAPIEVVHRVRVVPTHRIETLA